MALQVVYGESRFRSITRDLAARLEAVITEGTIYLGYPVLSSSDEKVAVDAMLVSPECGLVAFQVADDFPTSLEGLAPYIAEQDRLYGVLESHLGRHDALRSGRRLAFNIETVTLFPSATTFDTSSLDGHYIDLERVADLVQNFDGVSERVYRALQAALQRVSTIKPAKKRSAVKIDGSRGSILKEIEKGIANLDRWQKRAAIETPEGPQRIRGLAGSGKTVVLALKAAYLHAQNPEWNVVLTFQSRALYQQLDDLVTRFSFEHSNDRPDPEHLQIIHAWGSPSRRGVYQMIATALSATPRDYNFASATYGREGAFQGICRELLTMSEQRDVEPIFDAVLIDEAQDLPPEFFQLVYKFTRAPKRIIWGFDELQRISETAMPTTDELFGTTPSGQSMVSLDSASDEAARDVILPVCYRNSPWTLATAHALGFGIYRGDGPVQHFDEPSLWRDIGYETVRGKLELDEEVVLRRRTDSYPTYFPELLRPEESVKAVGFVDELAQDEYVSKQIARNLSKDELEHDDILVVLPDAYTSKRRAARFARTLSQHNVDCHLVGVGSSVDEVFVRGSIAVAHIYRAKGNEAPMVYVLDAQYAVSDINILTRRNTLFTAMTRSRAWVQVTGWGDKIEDVVAEVKAVRDHEYTLDFKIPSVGELAKLRRVHRDRSESEAASLHRATRKLQDLVEAFERDEISLDDLPPRLRDRLLNQLRTASGETEY